MTSRRELGSAQHSPLHGLINTVLILLVLATCLRVWIGPFPVLPEACAQIPDAGAQRKILIEQVQQTNEHLAAIRTLLAERTLNVRIQGADNPSGRGNP